MEKSENLSTDIFLSNLVAKAKGIYNEIIISSSSAVSITELFDSDGIETNFKEGETKKIVRRHLEFDNLMIKACLPSQRQLLNKTKVQGLYIFIENSNFVYVGISRDIYKRVKQHFYGKTHYSASYVYGLAKQAQNYLGKREELDFSGYQNTIRETYKFIFCPVENEFELYWLEVTLAGLLKTRNSFKTH